MAYQETLSKKKGDSRCSSFFSAVRLTLHLATGDCVAHCCLSDFAHWEAGTKCFTLVNSIFCSRPTLHPMTWVYRYRTRFLIIWSLPLLERFYGCRHLPIQLPIYWGSLTMMSNMPLTM